MKGGTARKMGPPEVSQQPGAPRLRIAMLADLYHPHLSGVTTHIDLLKRFLERAGHKVWVLTFGEGKGGSDDERVIRSKALPIGLRYGSDKLRFGMRMGRSAAHLLGSMDVIHAHHPFPSGWLALRHAKPGQPVVFTHHTRYDLHLKAALPGWMEAAGQRLAGRYIPWFCSRCSLIIAPSPAIRARLVEARVGSRIETVPCGTDLTIFEEPRPTSHRRDLGFGDDEVVLIYVGRLAKEKNLDALLDVFSTSARRDPRLRLVLVGDGPERGRLERRLARSRWGHAVHLTGKIPHRSIPHWLQAADLFVTASQSEVCPISVVEAMAAGLPVAALEAPGLVDLIRDGVDGRLSRDVREFSERLSKLVADSSLRRRYGKRAREAAIQFDLPVWGGRLLQEYVRLAGRDGSDQRD